MVGNIFISDEVPGSEGVGENGIGFTRFSCLFFFLHNHLSETSTALVCVVIHVV